MAGVLIARHPILAVFPFHEDCISLQTILDRSSLQVQFTTTFDEAREALSTCSFGAVISEGRLPEGLGWKDLLREIQDVAEPPPLIVVDRLADEWLWAEVLKVGGYDVLIKPFDAREVLHAVTTACDFRRMSAVRKSVKSAQESLPERTRPRALAGD